MLNSAADASRDGGSSTWNARAGSRGGLGPDPALHLFHHFLGDGQSCAGAFEFLLSNEPVEKPEDALVVLHVEPDAVVHNGDANGAALFVAA